MPLKLIYVYDALCTWCYGFSPVITSISETYADRFEIEVISGGLLIGTRTGPLAVVGSVIQTSYKTIQETSGVAFGEGFLKQLDKGDLIFDSEKPAIALSVFKSYQPRRAVQFAHDLQQCIFFDGKGPNDEEMYRYLAVNFGIGPEEFVFKMHEDEFKQAAYYDFALARQLRADSYPSVFIQSSDSHFYMVGKGFATLETMELRIENVLKEINQ